MACKKPWCLKCLKEDKPESKTKERLKKKIEKRNSLQENKKNDLVRENAADINRVVANIANVERAKFYVKKQSFVSNKKQQIQLKEVTTSAEVLLKKTNNANKMKAQKERNKKDSKMEKNVKQNTSVEIKKIIDFIEGKDHEADILKKQKNQEKRARRREKKLIEKQIEDEGPTELPVKPESSKESEQFVLNSIPDVKNVTINHDSKKDALTLTLSLTGSSDLIEKIITTVVQAVPDVKKSFLNAAGWDDDKLQNISHPEKEPEPSDTVFEITNMKKKKNKKKQLPQKKYETSNDNHNLTNNENATISQCPDGRVIIKRPGINVGNVKIDRWKSIPVQAAILNSNFNYKIGKEHNTKIKNCSLTNKPFNKNKENFVSNREMQTNNNVNNEDLNRILHGLPEITITRHEKNLIN